MKSRFLCVLTFALFGAYFIPNHVQGAKILFYFAVAGPSHRISAWPIIEKLAQNHQVTFVSPYPSKNKNPSQPNITDYVPENCGSKSKSIYMHNWEILILNVLLMLNSGEGFGRPWSGLYRTPASWRRHGHRRLMECVLQIGPQRLWGINAQARISDLGGKILLRLDRNQRHVQRMCLRPGA